MTNEEILKHYSIPENFWKLYSQYQELLSISSSIEFWESEFQMMLKQKNELENKYNKDLQEFAEWCSLNQWEYNYLEKSWYPKINMIKMDADYLGLRKTTSKLQEIWEIETGRRKV